MNRRTNKPGQKTAEHAARNAGRLLAAILSLCLAALPWGAVCQAAEGYTYTVTFYPGNHGTFNGTGGISVPGGADAGVSVWVEGQAIKVGGLKKGDMVSFDAALWGAVALEEGGRYYVKGIRLSGRDNNTVDTPAFRVEGDRDYVVAYGIRGDMTGYTVNYQDEAGNELAPSRSYYGNVGDKPVVAFLYVEGYEPMAYNLTKTLVSNEAENAFTFVYRRAPAGGGDGPSGGGGTGGDTPSGGNPPSVGNAGTGDAQPGSQDEGLMPDTEGTVDGTDQTDDAAGNGGEDAGAMGGENAGGIDGNEADGINGAQAGNEGTGNEGENIELGDEEVPLDLMELDEDEVPLANNVLEGAAGMEEGSRIFAASTVLVAASVGVLVCFAFWMKRNLKNKDK